MISYDLFVRSVDRNVFRIGKQSERRFRIS